MSENNISRRTLLLSAAGALGAATLGRGQERNVQDPSRVPGTPSQELGARSSFEQPHLAPTGITTGGVNAPLHKLTGTITPADLHFQRHHNGVPAIDPRRHRLILHGMVEQPLIFTVDELKRFPAVSRTCCIECSGNGRTAYRAPKREMTVQDVDGLTSNSEWTGVLLSTLLAECGVQPGASWILAEGGDAPKLTRSIPLAKALDDVIIAYGQNGEALRAPNGYPVRLIVPGYEGNMNVKWIRRIKVGDQPWMTKDETSKYTDPLPNDTARIFSFVMDAKSIITSPTFPHRITPGWWPISGIAWSGRGRIAKVEVSTDGGRRWHDAELQGPIHSMAHTRFGYMWKWTGGAARLMSRATDETGNVQPTLAEFTRQRGSGTDYHFNHIRAWDVEADGRIFYGVGA